MQRRSGKRSTSNVVNITPSKGNGEDLYLDTETPAVDTLYGYMSGLISASVLQSAQNLGIFDALEENGGPWTAEKLAEQLGFHAGSTERLLNALTSMKLLVKEPKSAAVYRNSDVGKLLVKNNPNTLKEMVTWMGFFHDALKQLPDVVKKGPEFLFHNEDESGHHEDSKESKPVLVDDMEKCKHGNFHDGSGNVFDETGNKVHVPGAKDGNNEMTCNEGGDGAKKSTEKMEKCQHGNFHDKDGSVYDESGNKVHGAGKDQEKVESSHDDEDFDDCCDADFYEGMHNLLRPSSAKFMTAVDLSSHKSAVDLGGGSGMLCFELKQQYPDMEVTLFEKEKVINIFKDNFLPGNEGLNIKTIAGDWNKTPLPEASLYILSQVVHEIENADEILKKVYSVLPPGGGIMILENILANDKASLMQPHLWDLIMMTHGSVLRSPAEFRSWLKNIGFQDITIIRTQENNEYDMIYAKKPEHSGNKKTRK